MHHEFIAPDHWPPQPEKKEKKTFGPDTHIHQSQ
jgi:hypothetical protein